jgi:hypothetical protein
MAKKQEQKSFKDATCSRKELELKEKKELLWNEYSIKIRNKFKNHPFQFFVLNFSV